MNNRKKIGFVTKRQFEITIAKLKQTLSVQKKQNSRAYLAIERIVSSKNHYLKYRASRKIAENNYLRRADKIRDTLEKLKTQYKKSIMDAPNFRSGQPTYLLRLNMKDIVKLKNILQKDHRQKED